MGYSGEDLWSISNWRPCLSTLCPPSFLSPLFSFLLTSFIASWSNLELLWFFSLQPVFAPEFYTDFLDLLCIVMCMESSPTGNKVNVDHSGYRKIPGISYLTGYGIPEIKCIKWLREYCWYHRMLKWWLILYVQISSGYKNTGMHWKM